jgi:O-acetyl-ADP-ribose deacetylase (regulator of RNase III)
MPTELVKGDLFEDAGKAFAFGAECDGTMNSGVAAAFKKRWPALAAAFAAAKLEPGDVFAWSEGGVTVYALGLAREGKKPKVSTLERALRAMVDRATKDGVARVALPRLGGGKSGLDWARVKRILEELGGTTTLTLVCYEQFIRQKPDATS